MVHGIDVFSRGDYCFFVLIRNESCEDYCKSSMTLIIQRKLPNVILLQGRFVLLGDRHGSDRVIVPMDGLVLFDDIDLF